MVNKSRFLKQGSVPPSSTDRYGSEISYSRSSRARSAAPSRDYRATSTVPSRDFRAASIVPSSSYRSRSVAPLRATSVAPISARSVSRYRSASVAPMRASSLGPYSPVSTHTPYRASNARASSVAPYSRSALETLSSVPYATSYRTGDMSSFRASSVPAQQHVSFRSTPLLSRGRVTSNIDTSIPTRQFGTRLGVQKMETTIKPAIYDEYYATTYVPSSGRDSWSAYRISDETLDDNDDLVYESAKKDHDVMKRVNKQMQQVEALNVRAPVFIPVAPAYKRFTPQNVPKIVPVPTLGTRTHMVNKSVAYRRPVTHTSNVHRGPVPDVKISYSAAFDATEMMRPKNRSISNESIDLAQPAKFNVLKERLREARASMDRNKTTLSKYEMDPDMRAINSEVNAIRNARSMREKSLSKSK